MQKSSLSIVALALVAGLVGGSLAVSLAGNTKTPAAERSVFDRVKESGTLRCGYIVYEPYFTKDPNTGKMAGIFYDLTEEMGRRLSLKVEWTEEVGWATFIEGIKAGRYDALCSGLSPSAAEGREMAYTMPVYYTAVGVYVRANDERFVGKPAAERWAALNRSDVKISSMDGSLNSIIAKTDFPDAEIFSIPNMSDESVMAENVVAKKADVNFMEVYRAAQFDVHNPGKLMNIDATRPIRVFPNLMGLPLGDARMKSMMDSALGELFSSGYVDQILKKYETVPGAFLRATPPYQTPHSAP